MRLSQVCDSVTLSLTLLQVEELDAELHAVQPCPQISFLQSLLCCRCRSLMLTCVLCCPDAMYLGFTLYAAAGSRPLLLDTNI
jgi:hypothetical protein